MTWTNASRGQVDQPRNQPTPSYDDRLADWVRMSTSAQGVPEKITTPFITAELATMVKSARRFRPFRPRVATVATLPTREAMDAPARGPQLAG
jgi:hypothetical protein